MNSQRINKFVAQASGLSRRAADTAIAFGRVSVNGQAVSTGQQVMDDDIVTLDGHKLMLPDTASTIMLNKPTGYVVSRNGQGSPTIYELLPTDLQQLKPIGRLDKDSSGLMLLTDDGQLANELTHPRHQKVKIYEVSLNKPLQPLHNQMINDIGIQLDDGTSQLRLARLTDNNYIDWQVTMREGRNRQIRRTFMALGYRVSKLHRVTFGSYQLDQLAVGKWQSITESSGRSRSG